MGYSADSQERIVEAVLERRFSIREAADTFRVGHATVERYLRRFRERGELTPCKPPGRPSRVEGEQLGALRKQLGAHNELTLIEHCELWEGGTGVKLSYVTMHRISKRLDISRKKRPSQPVSKTP
jgi:putative transposase